MDSNSFFERPKSHSKVKGKKAQNPSAKSRDAAARVIQQWWKQARLQQTAEESSTYINQILSLEKANDISFSELTSFVQDKKNKEITHKLLLHLEQAKDLLLPERQIAPTTILNERVFLTAYLIASKPKYVLLLKNEIDNALLEHAIKMLVSFENLCEFMGKTYFNITPVSPSSPIAIKTPSIDQVIENLRQHPLEKSYKKMEADASFISHGHHHLEEFHLRQVQYFQTYHEWEKENRTQIVNACIDYFLQLESKRFFILNNPEPMQKAMYVGFGNQQEILKRRVSDLAGEEGVRQLEQELKNMQENLDEKKWAILPKELLLHEIAINSEFVISEESCEVHPELNIELAIDALTKRPIDINPITRVLEEVGKNIARLTPNNQSRADQLYIQFNDSTIKKTLESSSLDDGLCNVICSLAERIKELGVQEDVSDIEHYQIEFTSNFSESSQKLLVLKEAIAFLYEKISVINWDVTNFYIENSRNVDPSKIAIVERENFQKRINQAYFNFANVFSWVEQIVNSPKSFRANSSYLCSKYVGTHIASAMLIGVLEQKGSFDFDIIPETFYLDRPRLAGWHQSYQRIFYAASALGFYKMVLRNSGLQLQSEELQELKQHLLNTFDFEKVDVPEEAAKLVLSVLLVNFAKKGVEISETKEAALQNTLEEIYAGEHQVAKIIYRRLGDLLSSYFMKGKFPTYSNMQDKLYGLQPELEVLAFEIRPLLEYHIKVHNDFYRRCVEERLWKPLVHVLKAEKFPDIIPALLSPQRDLIYDTHQQIHKLAFLLTGLSIIQQTVAFSDMWDLSIKLSNDSIKSMAESYGLIKLLSQPESPDKLMEDGLINLMQHVAEQEEISFESSDEKKIRKMLRMARCGKSPGYRAFVDELTSMVSSTIKQHTLPNIQSNLLTVEFSTEVNNICSNTIDIIKHIKQARRSEDINPMVEKIPEMRTGLG